MNLRDGPPLPKQIQQLHAKNMLLKLSRSHGLNGVVARGGAWRELGAPSPLLGSKQLDDTRVAG